MRIPTTPAAEAPTWMWPAAPVLEGLDPDSVALADSLEEPEPEGSESELESEPESEESDPESEESEPGVDSGASVAAGAVAPPVKNSVLMQSEVHLLYASASSGVPDPCGHLATQSLVKLAMLSSGHGTPTHSAAQQRSVSLQAARHLASGVRGALVLVAWGAAAAKAARPEIARMLTNFIVTVRGLFVRVY